MREGLTLSVVLKLYRRLVVRDVDREPEARYCARQERTESVSLSPHPPRLYLNFHANSQLPLISTAAGGLFTASATASSYACSISGSANLALSLEKILA